MKTTYIIPILAFVVGLALTTVAAYYSILGLTTIFVGGLLGFIFMEVAKVITTLLLHKHWHEFGYSLKYTLTAVVISLMCITSMGTFGYLSKASLDKGSNVSINSATIVNLESSIQREQAYLDQNLKQIESYSNTVSKLITDDPRRASRERRNIQTEIKKLTEDNKVHADTLDKLNKELLPYKTEVKKHEVEVGPLLYIAKLIYGEDYKAHTEKILSWLIILIVLVFDPLAILLLVASQQSFYLIRSKREFVSEIVEPILTEEPEMEVVEELEEIINSRKKRDAKSSQM